MFKKISTIKQSDEEYFANNAISNSDLTYFNQNGFANFWNYKFGEKPRLETDQLTLGSYIHCLVLEPQEVNNRFVVLKGVKPKSPNQADFASKVASGINPEDAYLSSYKQDKKTLGDKHLQLENELKDYILYLAHSKGKIPITEEQNNIALNCLTNLEKLNKRINLYDMSKLNLESTIYGSYYSQIQNKEMQLKCKIDAYEKDKKGIILFDLKTTSNCSPKSFNSSIIKYSYLRQMSFYKELLEAESTESNEEDKVILIFIVAIQTQPPYHCQVYEVPIYMLNNARLQIKEDLEKLAPYMDNPIELLNAEQDIIEIDERTIVHQI